MKVPMLDVKAQLAPLEQPLKAAVNEVIDSGRHVMGPRVEELETALASYCGARFGIGVSSGTDALLMCLMALDVGPGDLVITPNYSFFATAGVVARLNARPIFIDIDPVTYNLDAGALRQWFDHHPADAERVKAIIPVHLYGQCVDMDPVLEVACAHNVAVVEDAAQAIGAGYPGQSGLKRAGALGLAGCFSFYPSKNLSGMGDGGLIVTNDEAFAEKLRLLRNHGEYPRYHHKIVGGNFRLDPLQAAVVRVKLDHLDDWHAARRCHAAYYDDQLSDSDIATPTATWGREHHIYNQYIISVPERRDDLLRHLQEAGIGCAIYYPVPFHLQECFADLGGKPGDLPLSEYAARHTLAIPVYPELTEQMQDYVVEQLLAFYR